MLLGIKSTKIVLLRYLVVGIIAALITYLVWAVNGTWSPDMRLWKAFGGGSFALLWFAVFIGPAARLWHPLARLVSFRREAGVWFFLIALVHGYLVLDGWARWSVWEFFGYQYIAEAQMYMRVESGFGLANLLGLVALIFGLALAATSFDRAVNFLGTSAWKWLHSFSYVIFYLGALHTIYFAFIQYSPSLLRAVLGQPMNYPDNPLKYYYLAAFLSVLVAQTVAFIITVRKHRDTSW
jgi:sulfoxide reductase heme-binding subunit YedZ